MESWSVVVCRRGHVLNNERDGSNQSLWSRDWQDRACPRCGGKVHVHCPNCDAGLRAETNELFALTQAVAPFPFCTCGHALPWADRQAKIHELENLLEEEGLDPGDEAMARQQLSALQRADLSTADEVKLWTRLRELAPTIWDIANGRGILTALVTSEAKSRLGLPL